MTMCRFTDPTQPSAFCSELMWQNTATVFFYPGVAVLLFCSCNVLIFMASYSVVTRVRPSLPFAAVRCNSQRQTHTAFVVPCQRRCPLKVAQQKVASFHQTAANLTFLTEEITGVQNFTFASKFPQMGDFQPQILYVWNNIFRQATIWGEGPLPPPPLTSLSLIITQCV